MVSQPHVTSSAGIISALVDFPFFSAATAMLSSSRRVVVAFLLCAGRSQELNCHQNSHGCLDISPICHRYLWVCPVFLKLDSSPVIMLFCCCFCSSKFKSPHTEYLSNHLLL